MMSAFLPKKIESSTLTSTTTNIEKFQTQDCNFMPGTNIFSSCGTNGDYIVFSIDESFGTTSILSTINFPGEPVLSVTAIAGTSNFVHVRTNKLYFYD